MKNLKKVVALIVVLSLVLTSISFTFASAASASSAPAKEIVRNLNIMLGPNGDPVLPDTYLNTVTKRYQAALIFLRLAGLYNEAKAFTGWTVTFDDTKTGFSADILNCLAYLKAKPELGWVGNGKTFSPNTNVTAQMFYKVMLQTLGYNKVADQDFLYAETIGFAKAIGMNQATNVASFTNGDMAKAIAETLPKIMKGMDKSLADVLVEKGVITFDNAVKYDLVANLATIQKNQAVELEVQAVETYAFETMPAMIADPTYTDTDIDLAAITGLDKATAALGSANLIDDSFTRTGFATRIANCQAALQGIRDQVKANADLALAKLVQAASDKIDELYGLCQEIATTKTPTVDQYNAAMAKHTEVQTAISAVKNISAKKPLNDRRMILKMFLDNVKLMNNF